MKLVGLLFLTVAVVGSIVAVNLWQRRNQALMTAEEKKAEEAALAEERTPGEASRLAVIGDEARPGQSRAAAD